jgi:transcriptional regulator with XRE-family HTH domain
VVVVFGVRIFQNVAALRRRIRCVPREVEIFFASFGHTDGLAFGFVHFEPLMSRTSLYYQRSCSYDTDVTYFGHIGHKQSHTMPEIDIDFLWSRDAKGYSLDELARLSNSSKSYLWELENRDERRPSAEKLTEIAKVLSVTTDYLLDENAGFDDAQVMEAFFRDFNQLTEDDKTRIRQIIEMPGTEIGPRSPAGSLPLTPYPGLRPFEQDEWPIFLGRERITRDIVDRLTGTQIVVIHGSSGCGKSSFVRAGVLAQLDRE